MATKIQQTGSGVRGRGLLATMLVLLVLAVVFLHFQRESVAQNASPRIGLNSPTSFPVDI